MTLKRLLLFAAPEYYASGGWLDFQTSADSAEELKAYYASHPENNQGDKIQWGMIVRASDGLILEGTGRVHYLCESKSGVWRPYVDRPTEEDRKRWDDERQAERR